MPRKRVLNITSTKKRNGMLSWSNTTSTGAIQNTAIGAAFINAANGGAFLFAPTKQSLVTAGVTNQIVDASDRTASTCYMKGFSEHIRYQTSSPLPWFWRRICFTVKGSPFTASPTPSQAETPYLDTSNGMERLWLNLQINNSKPLINSISTYLFKGVEGKDWSDVIIAPIDTARVTLRYDRTVTIKSGSSVGTVGEKKLWHGMNKNLVYDDDENGAATEASYSSVSSKAGMGDYYVIDFFSGGAGGGSGDILRIDSNATLYWHEK